MRVLIMGLPGSGKTTLANEIYHELQKSNLSIAYFNADKVREEYGDWDFSQEGRIRQAKRMRLLCDSSECDITIADFVAPTEEIRDIFGADFVIWMDTIQVSRYSDTNRAFQSPKKYQIQINRFDYSCQAEIIKKVLDKFNKT
jgi:adenylylsulfate kinase